MMEQLPEAWASQFPLLDKLAKEAIFNLEMCQNPRPKRGLWFEAFRKTPPDAIKVVILGQDPYYTDQNGIPHAHGLSFSVPEGTGVPPSLRNILKEMNDDLGIIRDNTDFSDLASQGVLLVNAYLTTEFGVAGKHKKIWENFNRELMKSLGALDHPIVFVLWGSPAQKFKSMIDGKHAVIESVHPSPLSSYRGFFGSKPFSLANENLVRLGKPVIRWG